MRTRLAVAFAALLMAGTAGCGGESGGSESGSGTQADARLAGDAHAPLVGTTWRIDQIIGGGTKLNTAGMEEPPRVLLTADGRVQIYTGCNTAVARVVADDSSIRFEQIEASRARCPGKEGRVGTTLFDSLSGRVAYEFDGPRLRWSGDGIDMYLSPMGRADKVAVPARADLLAGRTLVLNSVAGNALTLDAPLDLSFRRKRFSADAGCNSMGFKYKLSEGRMTGQLWVSTTALCPRPEGKQERTFQRLIREGAYAALSSDRLTLDFGDGVMADFVNAR